MYNFNQELLEKARQLFHTVHNDGDRIRIYPTGWDYEEAEIFTTNADLEKYINDELADRIYYYQHEFDYSEK